jgi:hypothetical protein
VQAQRSPGGKLVIRIDAIRFNHDSSAATRDAINLRKNATEWVHVPEWRHGISVAPEDSPAAYALNEVRGHLVAVQASFTCDEPALGSVEIRALDNAVDPPGAPGCLGFWLGLLRWLIRALFGNVLGDVPRTTVAFSLGKSGFVTFALPRARFATARVGIHTTEWRWQYRRRKHAAFVDIGITRHRIYTLLDVPTAPWQQAPYAAGNTQLPWTEALDRACTWAFGAATHLDAARGVTRELNQLGPTLISYDCPGGGSSHYSAGSFDCSAFLERLRGGFGNGYYVNCSDCATFVSTFANILGCDLWQSRMGWGFGLNPMLGIGSSVWQPCCHGAPGWGDSFSYHEVAWTGACGVDDHVFDACLRVDSDANPNAAPHTPLLPVHLRFGNTGDMDYRDRLATPAGSPSCQPQAASRIRRLVS